MDIEEGDYVRLKPRRAPYVSDPKRWWRVVAVHDYGLDAVYERALLERDGNRVEAFRNGVAFRDVAGHRRPQGPALS